MQTASRLCDYKYIIIIIIIYSYTPYVHNLKFLNVTLLQSYNVTDYLTTSESWISYRFIRINADFSKIVKKPSAATWRKRTHFWNCFTHAVRPYQNLLLRTITSVAHSLYALHLRARLWTCDGQGWTFIRECVKLLKMSPNGGYDDDEDFKSEYDPFDHQDLNLHKR